MTLSTVDSFGMPDSRMMLLHWINDGRFQFSSYDTSVKGKQLKAHPKAALLFYWKKTDQVVRVRGAVKKFTAAQTANLRPIKARSMDERLHDWVFRQSEVIQGPKNSSRPCVRRRAATLTMFPSGLDRLFLDTAVDRILSDNFRHGQCRAAALLAPPAFRPMDCERLTP